MSIPLDFCMQVFYYVLSSIKYHTHSMLYFMLMLMNACVALHGVGSLILIVGVLSGIIPLLVELISTGASRKV